MRIGILTFHKAINYGAVSYTHLMVQKVSTKKFVAVLKQVGGYEEQRNRYMKIEAFKNKVWLATPTMHGDELKYVQQAYDTNWMSTIGENINEVEKIAAEKADMKYAVGLSCCTAALHLAVKHASETLYGKPAISHGALEGKRVFCRCV